ncbi:TSUP family transporter [Thauera butanivorans]|jgi:uncharacterized membrane protein YfcA|uniref:TSUP family transporter n=1 Tax=Thauera butanivorans TaxID=86174 RepID=UPI0008398B51|nr:TSUP family transporter [Thauera butanivorans]
MDIETTAALLGVIAVGTYFQTVTGFGLGMIVMGITSGFGLAPITMVAVLISLVTLVNSAVALPGKLHHIDWPASRAVLLGVVPSVVCGVLLLEYLSAAAALLLELLLGITIIYSGIVFMLRPTPLSERSSRGSFFVSGFFSGLFGGLFGMAGPPVIFHFYRQPFSLETIRNMLLLTFAFTSGVRTIFAGTQGTFTQEVWVLVAFTVPLVTLATLAGRRYPPPFSAITMRRIAFGVLILIGGGLVFNAVSSMLR